MNIWCVRTWAGKSCESHQGNEKQSSFIGALLPPSDSFSPFSSHPFAPSLSTLYVWVCGGVGCSCLALSTSAFPEHLVLYVTAGGRGESCSSSAREEGADSRSMRLVGNAVFNADVLLGFLFLEVNVSRPFWLCTCTLSHGRDKHVEFSWKSTKFWMTFIYLHIQVCV